MYKRIQGNGSFTIPSKMRKRLGLEPKDALEIIEQENGEILLRPHNPQCIWCKGEENVFVVKGVRMCRSCYNKLQSKKEENK